MQQTIAKSPEMSMLMAKPHLTKAVCSARLLFDSLALTCVPACLQHCLLAAPPALETPPTGDPEHVHRHARPASPKKAVHVELCHLQPISTAGSSRAAGCCLDMHLNLMEAANDCDGSSVHKGKYITLALQGMLFVSVGLSTFLVVAVHARSAGLFAINCGSPVKVC